MQATASHALPLTTIVCTGTVPASHLFVWSGGISSGKSSVSAYLQSPRHGVALLDFDLIAREVVTPGHPSGALQSIRRRFGDGVLQADGSLDRAKLGAIIFGDAQARAQLNKAMQWPIWRTFLLHAGRLFFCEGRREVVLDVPLLFESKISAICSENVVVYTSPDVQKERLMKRGTHRRTDGQATEIHGAAVAVGTAVRWLANHRTAVASIVSSCWSIRHPRWHRKRCPSPLAHSCCSDCMLSCSLRALPALSLCVQTA